MSKYDVVVLLLCIIFFTSAMGGHFGYTVNGVPSKQEVRNPDEWTEHNWLVIKWWSNDNTGDLSVIEPGNSDWLVATFKFMFDMAFFQIDDIPATFNYVWILFNILALYLLYNAIRGNG